MLRPIGRKLYVSMKSLIPTGVFSSPEKAQAIPHDSITEIDPYVLDGSPISDEYVCMISGCCTLLRRDGDSFFTEYADVGPFWGVNPQSAAAYLCELGGRSVQCCQFLLFRIDQEYASGQPDNLHRSSVFPDLVQTFALSELITAEDMTTDYIALYFHRIREAEEYAAKEALPEIQLVTDYLMNFACKRATAGGRRILCGTPLIRDQERLKYALIHEFSTDELKQLSVLLGLTAPAEETPLSAENAKNLLRRAVRHIPRIITSTLSKKLQDYLD